MKSLFSKRNFIIGSIVISASLILAIFLLSKKHEQEQLQKQEYIKELEVKNEQYVYDNEIAKEDWFKMDKFIESHLPAGSEVFYKFDIPVESDDEPHLLVIFALEESLLNEDIHQWLGSFSTDASRDVLNSLESPKIEERETELLSYLKRMSREGKLVKLIVYEDKEKQYNLQFSYSDGFEVEIPIKYTSVKDHGVEEYFIDTNILDIIEQIETASS